VNIRTLRTVLLIQSIEEADRAGEILPLADRAEATREAARTAPSFAASGTTLSHGAHAFLGQRAERLLHRVRVRAPVIDQLIGVAGGLTWLGRTVLVIALAAGVSLSALDGSRRINILSFPLMGLIAWNLFVYVLLIIARVRRREAADKRGGFWSGRMYEHWVSGRIDSYLKRSERFNAPLAAGMRRFANEWIVVERPLLAEQAKRLLHSAAALLAIGLIIGLYFRGIALRYEAGWESTFLGAQSVRAMVAIIYAPAAAITGIPLPSLSQLEALRWTGSAGGGEAASWIHLIACTAAIYIVVPRLILASVSAVASWRLSRNPALPPALLSYARTLVLGASGGVANETASATPYSYEPSQASIAGLKTLLAAILGGVIGLEMRGAIAYGEEEKITAASDWNVLLMNLASTPETENHGLVISRLRDSTARSGLPLLIIVDTAPYAARMKGDASFDQRVRERRELWTRFVAGYGLRACVVDLSRIVAGAPSEIEARDAAREALWAAGEQATAK
jgi:hypothetical protein